jgi:L-aminopeptidase/D-esterase-like protein
MNALLETESSATSVGMNTTIGVVATDVQLTPDQANYLATVAHDGLARCIRPVHTLYDGDTMFGLATGTRPLESTGVLVSLAAATVLAVERAVVNAVRTATPLGGLPAAGGLNS